LFAPITTTSTEKQHYILNQVTTRYFMPHQHVLEHTVVEYLW